MLNRNIAIALVAFVAGTSGAFAAGANSPKTDEMTASDGWVFRGGEWSAPSHKIDRQGGQWVHTDTLSHNAAPATPRFSAEQLKLQRELYQN
jgi:hypothetical protein